MEKECFVIGGGPSLTGFDFDLLKDRTTIGVNHAIHSVVNPTYYITADSGVIKKSAVNNFWDIPKTTQKIVVMGSDHKRYKHVKDYLNKFDHIIAPKRYDGKIGFDYNSFATGKCTGFCALQFAVLCGYKKIYLLGIDLSAPNNKRHFYDDFTASNAGRKLDVFHKHFITALEILKNTDIEVISCSRISILNNSIEYISVESILKEIT